MADLHNFKEIARNSPNDPVDSRMLDENFRVCRTEVDASLESFIRREERFPTPDRLVLSAPSTGVFFPYIANGAMSLLSIPTTGNWYIRISNGTVSVIESGSCES